MRGGGKVAATLAVLAGAVAAADELILQLGRENDRLCAKLRDPGFPDDLVEALADEIVEVEERIAALPASTSAALADKLRIAADNLPSPEDRYGDHIALASLRAGVRARKSVR